MSDTSSFASRVAFSPGEFAALFGKSQTWGYRQIYAGKVTAITEHGRILIPAKEVERILEKAGIYDGKQKPKASKAEFKKLTPEEQSTWQKFVLGRHRKAAPTSSHHKPNSKSSFRKKMLSKIASAWGGKGAGH